jgi:hypothetical protein
MHSGRGYQSDYGKRLYFGLGNRTRVDQIHVKWIGGGVDVVRDVGADQMIKIVESSSAVPTGATDKREASPKDRETCKGRAAEPRLLSNSDRKKP